MPPPSPPPAAAGARLGSALRCTPRHDRAPAHPTRRTMRLTMSRSNTQCRHHAWRHRAGAKTTEELN
uniref:Uncharacterized protein n=1 Tax=Zea mays TaxID=4577 RepID=A0A804Q996_MAIZE